MSGSGGGIYMHDATAAVTLNGSTSVTNNVAWGGAGVSVDQAFPSSGSLTMNGSSSISGNGAESLGRT